METKQTKQYGTLDESWGGFAGQPVERTAVTGEGNAPRVWSQNTQNEVEDKRIKDALLYLAEHLEATETLSRRHGNPLPLCHKHAKNALLQVRYLIQ